MIVDIYLFHLSLLANAEGTASGKEGEIDMRNEEWTEKQRRILFDERAEDADILEAEN